MVQPQSQKQRVTANNMQDEICPDFHTCRNGSRCIESTQKEGSFVCDCDHIGDFSDTAFAGVACEHEATVNCNQGNKKSYTSFCTNGGTCHQFTSVNGPHAGCDCPDSYKGEYCEYLVGQLVPEHLDPTGSAGSNPELSPASGSSGGGSDGASVFAIIAIVFVAGLAAVVVSYMYMMRRVNNNKGQTQAAAKAATAELALEADGAVLQSALSDPTSPSHVLNKNAGHQRPDQDDDIQMEPTFVIDEDGASDAGEDTDAEKGGLYL
eukprot:CAMPEP_0172455192 /NCGR_PEP_ID=MMETSP1065-20121228/11941_1 /TAXON_ID=265537 /ORGANISM="Amphiprora paludosa, Strain CCMP125" /LENGTH=264 /DNA_ID=CAMNT_0013207651 /DNA_START=126 /DNA_END=920 /DNA_ORIENTATION=-